MRRLPFIALGIIGAFALSVVALQRGEPVNSLWLVVAAIGIYAVSYRFYHAWIAAKVLTLNDKRATPAEELNNGIDYEPTHKMIVFGHHFAAIAGPGPLVGPVLAAQFGYLPGTLWLVLGAALGGAVHDLVILAASIRRKGRSLGEMAKEEIGKLGGFTALVTVFLIMVILLAVIGLVVVNALRDSPWGTFTIAATIPIALFMGIYLRFLRPGKVNEVSILGFILVVSAIFGGQAVAQNPAWAAAFTWTGPALAIALIVYGFSASALPVWLLLAPRDYLSSFVKIGVATLLAIGILVVHPQLKLPALTQFIDGTGPVFAGAVFPFCFITIGCGALSGFHSLISSGTTPKILKKESDALPVAAGSMLTEGVVATLALIAAAALDPGVYFAVNSPAAIVGPTPQAAVETISKWGYPVTVDHMHHLATSVGEGTLFQRTGGAPTLALGMAQIFASTGLAEGLLGFWYHFAIMFEALFILTVIDAGTRVGRFLLQDLLGHVWAPIGRVSWMPGVLLTSAIVVAAWGYFLYQGVVDPLGGVNSLWPMFGIANQLLGVIALSVGTTILIKKHGPRYIWITLAPMVWLVSVTFTAAYQKVFSPLPRLGFLAQASHLENLINSGNLTAAQIAQNKALIFNARLDAVICSAFIVLVSLILVDSVRVWYAILAGKREATLNESPFVPSRLETESA
ncbi:MAG: carbon starvation protein A [Acidobacteria bacterium]|nr:carbon starvation protein A [Acidobacteriota bacterium]